MACEATDEASVARAQEHARALVEMAREDVSEIRRGLPLGAAELARAWGPDDDLLLDPEAARKALHRTRDVVQDLRVSKATFFALARPAGEIVRNDREQDLMAGENLLRSFPGLGAAAQGTYVEALGAMAEANGVRGKPDAQWVAAHGIQVRGGVRALYATGWAWSSYCYRLEFALRGRIESGLKGTRDNVPLLYAFALVGDGIYSAPESPEINAQAIAKLAPWSKLGSQGTWGGLLDVTGRRFAFAAAVAPEIGPRVAFAVLRSET